MKRPEPVVKGFFVNLINKDNPKGKQISRIFHARSAAQDFRDLYEKTQGKPGDQVQVSEKWGVDDAFG